MTGHARHAIAAAAVAGEPERALQRRSALRVGLLTGGDDRSYALGLATSLVARAVYVDFIGSDAVRRTGTAWHTLR